MKTTRSWANGDARVVFCHDWLTGMRGGERVLEALVARFPDAPIYTLFHNPSAICRALNAHPVRTSWLQRLPGIQSRYRYLLPLFPSAITSLRPPEADLLVSLSHCVAKAIRPARGARHLCYCFTPMRYAWLFQDEYLGRNPLKRAVARPLLAWLRQWDRRTAGRVDSYVAISRYVQERIRRFYGRESEVVYPPVDTVRWTPGPARESGPFDLVASALVPYKRIDLAVAAYTRTGFPLKIVGTGTEAPRLRAHAGPNIEWLGWQSDDALLELYRACRLLVFPGEEDFGIVPLEAQACGRPVVAFGRGGVTETVADGATGLHFPEQTVSCLIDAVERAAARSWDPVEIRRHAEQFDTSVFLAAFGRAADRCLREA